MSAAAKRPSDTEDLSLCLTVSIALSRTLSGSATPYNLHLISISKKSYLYESCVAGAVVSLSLLGYETGATPPARLGEGLSEGISHPVKIHRKQTLSLSRRQAREEGARQDARENVGDLRRNLELFEEREKNVSRHQEKLTGFNARKKSIRNNGGREVKWRRLRVRVNVARYSLTQNIKRLINICTDICMTMMYVA